MSGPGDNFQPNGVPNPSPGGSNSYPIPPANQGMPPMAPPGFGTIPPPSVGGQKYFTSAPFPGFYFLPPLPMPNVQASSVFSPHAPFYFSELQGIPMPMGIRFPSPQLPMFFAVPPPSVPHVPSPPLTSTVVKKTKTTKSSTVVKKKKKTIWSNNSAAASPIPRGRDRRGVGGRGA